MRHAKQVKELTECRHQMPNFSQNGIQEQSRILNRSVWSLCADVRTALNIENMADFLNIGRGHEERRLRRNTDLEKLEPIDLPDV